MSWAASIIYLVGMVWRRADIPVIENAEGVVPDLESIRSTCVGAPLGMVAPAEFAFARRVPLLL